jgi:hypothetical protein
VKIKNLKTVIKEYNTLHKWNINFYQTITKDFFSDVFNDYKKKYFIINKIQSEYLSWVKYYYQQATGISKDFTFLYLENEENEIKINVSDSSVENERLNEHQGLQKRTTEWLKSNFKYSGHFIFTEDILPF